jgi:hypothetical protein
MLLDLLGAVELTASAAIVVAAAAIAFGPDQSTRRGLVLALTAWFALVVTLAATKALNYESGTGSPGVAVAVFLPILVLSVSLLRLPALRRGLEQAPLALLAGVHVVRLLGVNFLLLHAGGRLPAPFAPAAGWGDILVGAVALPVAWLVARRANRWRAALTLWNVIGLLDLVDAIALGVLSSPGPLNLIHATADSDLMSTLPWLLIPGFLVPLLVTMHLAIFWRLYRSSTAAPEQPLPARIELAQSPRR